MPASMNAHEWDSDFLNSMLEVYFNCKCKVDFFCLIS